MYPMKFSLKDYRVSKENLTAYQDLCKELTKSSSLFSYVDPALDLPASQGGIRKRYFSGTGSNEAIPSPSKQRKIKKNVCISEKFAEVPVPSDIKSFQKNFLSSLNSVNAVDVKLYKSIEPSQVCANDSSVISDEVLIQVCRKSEKVDDNVASVIGMLFVLPKVYHLTTKPTPSCCSAMCEYVRWHPKTAVLHVLVPFLQHCPETREQHRDIVMQLTEPCPAPLLTHLLRSLASREVISDVDLQVFQHVCTKIDPEVESTHTSVLAFLGKAMKSHQSSVKFGQCLMFIVKQMGQHIRDDDTLQSVVDNHSSGMKKVIQIHLKKVLKNR